MDPVLRQLDRKIRGLERGAVRFRMGTITDLTPLSVALGGADESYVDVASLGASLAVNDIVPCLKMGSDVLVLGGGGPTGPAGATGAAGAAGAAGANGRDAGVNYQFNTATTNADPSSGKLKLNNATLASATALYISETDDDAAGVGNWLATWDDSTSTVKGFVLIRKVGTPATFALYSISGTITDNGTWDTFTITHVASNGSFSNNDETMVHFYRTGDKGDTGVAGPVQPGCFDARLTLVSGDPVPAGDQTAKTNVYLTPYGGSSLSLYTSSVWTNYTLTEKTLALGTLTADKNYDVFAYDSAAVVTLEAVAWTSDSARATALVLQDGVFVKSGSTNKRYCGTFRTTTTTTTEDSIAKRFVWNYYNRKSRSMAVTESTDNWTYGTDTWRQARAQTANQLSFVVGVAEDAVTAKVEQLVNPGTNSASISIGLDSTSAPHANATIPNAVAASTFYNLAAGLDVIPVAGYHYLAWLEKSTGASSTFYSQAGSPVGRRSGIHGAVFA